MKASTTEFTDWVGAAHLLELARSKEMTVATEQLSDRRGLEFFGRHLVALCITYTQQGDDPAAPPRFKAYSGTLILIDGQLCLLTAGHILKAVDEGLRSDKVNVHDAALADIFGGRRISDIPIPLSLESQDWFFLDRDGLDFGVIRLNAHYARLLAKNGVVALEERNWIHQPGKTFEAHAMMGLPEEFASDHVSSQGDAVVSPTIFRVHRLPDDQTCTYPRFVGRLDEELPIKSVVGMSGGPIFGFRQEGDGHRYWIVALQSVWNPGSRLVYGSLLPVLASAAQLSMSCSDRAGCAGARNGH